MTPEFDTEITFKVGSVLCLGVVRGAFKHLDNNEVYIVAITPRTHLVYHVKASTLEVGNGGNTQSPGG